MFGNEPFSTIPYSSLPFSQVGKDIVLIWNVRKQIIKNIDLIWNVYTSVNKDITLLWNVDKLLSDVILNFNLYIQQDLEIETKIQQLLSMRNNINQINDKVRQNYVR
jgi:predicted methyltransferase